MKEDNVFSNMLDKSCFMNYYIYNNYCPYKIYTFDTNPNRRFIYSQIFYILGIRRFHNNKADIEIMIKQSKYYFVFSYDPYCKIDYIKYCYNTQFNLKIPNFRRRVEYLINIHIED